MKLNLFLTVVILLSIFSACKKKTQYKIPASNELNREYYQKALVVLDESLEDDPDNADVYFKKSRILLEVKQPKAALSNIDKAIGLAGNNAEYSLVKIRAHADAGEMQQAFEEAQEAIKTGNVSEDLYSIVAEGNLQNGNFRQAIRYADAALKLNSNNGENYYRKGLAYEAISDTAIAAALYLESIEHGLPPEAVYPTLVKMYVDYDNYDQAYYYLQKMNSKMDPQMQFQEARILRKVAETDSASTLFYSFLHNPEKLELIGKLPVYRELRDIYTDAKIYDSTLFYSEKILSLDEEDKETRITMARIYDQRKDYAQAVSEYNKILNMDSTLQPNIHKLASEELDDLQRKVAYLQKRREEKRLKEQLRPIAPLNRAKPQKNND